MKIVKLCGIVAIGLGLAVACSGTSSGGAGGGNGGAQSGSHCPATAPPANIDLSDCQSIVSGTSPQAPEQCLTCCAQTGFPAANFINSGKCTCGKPRPQEADAGKPCASALTSNSACNTCCDDHHYFTSVWSSGTSCECSGRGDATVCACALSDPSPADSCARCCLANGYIIDEYNGAQCTCFTSG
jgi:hypothetical protein